MVQTLGQGNPYWKTVTSARELIRAINSEDATHVKLLEQTYDVGAEILTPTVDSGGTIAIEGMGVKSVIKGSGTSILDAANGAWDGNVEELFLSDLKIEHNCSNAGDITIDGSYTHLSTKNLWLSQQNGTRNGIGIKTGPTGCAGKGTTHDRVTVSNYAYGFDSAMDHTLGLNCVANNCLTSHFYIHASIFQTWIKPDAYVSVAGVRTNTKPFLINPSHGFYFFAPTLECTTATTNPMFNNAAAFMPAYIYSPDCDVDYTTQTLSSTYDPLIFQFLGSSGKFYPEYEEVAAAATPLGVAFNGRKVTQYNSTGPAYRLYTYDHGAWHYVTLT